MSIVFAKITHDSVEAPRNFKNVGIVKTSCQRRWINSVAIRIHERESACVSSCHCWGASDRNFISNLLLFVSSSVDAHATLLSRRAHSCLSASSAHALLWWCPMVIHKLVSPRDVLAPLLRPTCREPHRLFCWWGKKEIWLILWAEHMRSWWMAITPWHSIHYHINLLKVITIRLLNTSFLSITFCLYYCLKNLSSKLVLDGPKGHCITCNLTAYIRLSKICNVSVSVFHAIIQHRAN